MPDLQREKFYMRALTEGLHIQWERQPEKSETPDFLCGLESRTVGVEITAFYLPAADGRRPPQEQTSLRSRVVATAERLYAESTGIPLYVTISFRNEVELDKSEVPALALAISEAVRRTDVRNTDFIAATVDRPELPKGVRRIGLRESINDSDKLWYASRTEWVARIDQAHIQTVVDKKTRVLARARKRCDEIWLTIVQDDFGLGKQAEISETACNAKYDFEADRLLWLIAHGPRVLELKRSDV